MVLHLVEAHGVAQGQVVRAGLHRGAPVHLLRVGSEGRERDPKLPEENSHVREGRNASLQVQGILGAGLPSRWTAGKSVPNGPGLEPKDWTVT
jgi:hypothetical protein